MEDLGGVRGCWGEDRNTLCVCMYEILKNKFKYYIRKTTETLKV